MVVFGEAIDEVCYGRTPEAAEPVCNLFRGAAGEFGRRKLVGGKLTDVSYSFVR